MIVHFCYDSWHCKVRTGQLNSQKGFHIPQARHSLPNTTQMPTNMYKSLCIFASKSPGNSKVFRRGTVVGGAGIVNNCNSGFVRSQEGSDTNDHFPIEVWWEEMGLCKTEFCLNEHATTVPEDFKASIMSWIKSIYLGTEGQLKPKHRVCNYCWGLAAHLQYI